ncbi:MAG TPA: hypothetical protein VGH81_07260 [Rudaea sp.]|jgi:hypothetical protein
MATRDWRAELSTFASDGVRATPDAAAGTIETARNRRPSCTQAGVQTEGLQRDKNAGARVNRRQWAHCH